MKKIILFDPSRADNFGKNSTNLGDVIIFDSVNAVLQSIFIDYEIVRISTHTPITNIEKKLIKDSKFNFVGGSNLISSNIRIYNQWKSSYKKFIINLPIVNNAILFGVGWWQYQDKPSIYTKLFYNKLLSSKYFHSVRDSYTNQKVLELGINRCYNTSCPTTWELHGEISDRIRANIKNVILTLTDYHPNESIDNGLIDLILGRFSGKIYFFPQGRGDLQYLKNLKAYVQNKSRFVLLKHEIASLDEFVRSNSDFVYIGTRLHGGIKCLQNGISSLILSNDNRAKEMGEDIKLAVVDRSDYTGMVEWIEYKSNFGSISLPMGSIENWKFQFLKY